MNARLTAFTKLSYAFPAFALAIVGIPVYVYIPKFYTDTLGVPVATAGVILLAIRLLDAVTDPLIGVVSDRAVSRFGRRRPMILAGAILVSVSILFLFNPPRMSSGGATLWFGVWASLLFLSWTIITVPYESLGPELTFDYRERISLFSVRDGFLLAGILAAAASPALIKAMVGRTSGPVAEARVYSVMSSLYIPLIIASAGWCVFFIRERISLPGAMGILKGLRGLAANRPFLILLVSYTISAIGNNLPAALILYYVEHVLRSGLADFFLLVYFVTGIVFLPLWIRIADRWGKKSAWLSSMAINTGAFSGVFFLGAGDEIAYGFLVFLSGAGFGATVAIPSSIQADVIDYDELMTGKRREGQYIGIWSLAKKIAAAGGVGIGLSLLGASGYRPDTVQSDGVVFTLRVLYSLVPSLCNAVAILIALAYPITGEMHARKREAISAREGGNEVDDPLSPGKTYQPGGGAPH
jgi:GPH family glycoside/pentoside/hexuronide:cation symporter